MKSGDKIKITVEFEIDVIKVTRKNDIADVKEQLALTLNEYLEENPEILVEPIIERSDDFYDTYKIVNISIQ